MTDINSPWTDALVARLKKLCANGLSRAEIGKAMGMSRNAVIGKLRRIGRCDRHGSRQQQRYTSEEDEQLKRYAALHLSGTEAATRMGRDRKSLYVRIRRLGLHFDSPVLVIRQKQTLRNQLAPTKRGLKPSGLVYSTENARDYPTSVYDRFNEGYGGQHGRLTVYECKDGLCRYPIDQENGPVVRFCGLPTPSLTHCYCPEHRARCFNPVSVGEKEPAKCRNPASNPNRSSHRKHAPAGMGSPRLKSKDSSAASRIVRQKST